jgi:hypothetical protein
MNPFYTRVAERAERRCEYCQALEHIFNFHFEVDHIRPVAQGGTNALTNLVLACPACNLYKSNAQTGFDADTGADALLFHPRKDQWNEHFRINADTGHIQGLTPVGRATIAQLQINHPVQIEARQLWIQLALFP